MTTGHTQPPSVQEVRDREEAFRAAVGNIGLEIGSAQRRRNRVAAAIVDGGDARALLEEWRLASRDITELQAVQRYAAETVLPGFDVARQQARQDAATASADAHSLAVSAKAAEVRERYPDLKDEDRIQALAKQELYGNPV
jgi:hypothetical protein